MVRRINMHKLPPQQLVHRQQLGYNTKPVGVLNVKGFYDGLLTFFDHAVTEGFVQPQYRGILQAESDPAALLDKLQAYQCPPSVVRSASNVRWAPDGKLFK